MAKTNKRRRNVTDLPSGGTIESAGREFNAYDKAGNFLGWSEDKREAEEMGQNGFTNATTIDHAEELSRWVLWNDAIAAGARVMVDDDGIQIMCLDDGIYMTAKDDKNGWTTELITENELEDRYWDESKKCYELRVMNEGKYRLE